MSLDLLRDSAAIFVPLAVQDAVHYHGTQRRKDGSPYLGHLFAVAAEVADDPAAMIAALLHDLVEDHGDELPAGYVTTVYGEEMGALIDALTHRPNEPRVAYLGRVIDAGPIARRVKLADLVHNYTHLEDPGVPAADRMRLAGKYMREIERLAPLVQDDASPSLALHCSAPLQSL